MVHGSGGLDVQEQMFASAQLPATSPGGRARGWEQEKAEEGDHAFTTTHSFQNKPTSIRTNFYGMALIHS